MRPLPLASAALVLALAACPAKDGTTPDGPTTTTGKNVQLTVPGFDFALDLPDDGAGTWALVEGGGRTMARSAGPRARGRTRRR